MQMKNNMDTLASPRLKRRSMSPVEYMNSQIYKKRKTNQQSTLKFCYLTQTKLNKRAHLKKNSSTILFEGDKASYIEIKQNQQLLDNNIHHDQNHLLCPQKNHIVNETSQTYEQKLSEPQSGIFRFDGECSEYCKEGSLIFQLEEKLSQKEFQIERKNDVISDQQRQLLEIRIKQKKLREQLQKIKIELLMERRKSQIQQKTIVGLKKRQKQKGKINSDLCYSDEEEDKQQLDSREQEIKLEIDHE